MRRVLSISTLYPNLENPRFGTFVARSLEALAARDDWDVTLISPIGLPPVLFGHYKQLAEALASGTERGVSVHRVRFDLVPRIGGRLNPASIARAVMPIARKLHAETPFDLVDAQFFYPDGPAAARSARDLGIPLSIKARGADISYWGGKDYARAQMLDAAEQAAGLLSVSEALAGDMAAIGLPRDRITIHYTGLDHDLFHPLDRVECRKRLGRMLEIELPPRSRLLASVGALIPRKGQKFVIGALARLHDTQLLLVGSGEDRDELELQARDAGLADRVHFLGALDQSMLPVVLSAADAMVLPSASEGLANAWVESLACGTPIVITDVGGARELVTSPSAGRLVERNAGAIAEAVEGLLAAQPAQEDVAASAAQFSWKANAAALAEYYEGLLA